MFDETSRASQVTLKATGATGTDSLTRGLREVARGAAVGKEPEGPLGTATLNAKQRVQMDITLEPGKCYAVVGYSNQVKDLDLYLFLGPGILSGKDTTDDNAPVIGGSGQPLCSVATAPIVYKLGIVANEGAGDMVVQLYSSPH